MPRLDKIGLGISIYDGIIALNADNEFFQNDNVFPYSKLNVIIDNNQLGTRYYRLYRLWDLQKQIYIRKHRFLS